MIISDPSKTNPIPLEQTEREVVDRLKGLKVSFFAWPDSSLARDLKNIQAERLEKILNVLFIEMQKEGKIVDPVSFLHQLAAILPLQELLKACSIDKNSVLVEIKSREPEAKHYLEMTEPSVDFGLYARLLTIRNGIVTLIESLISEFDLGQFFNSQEDQIFRGRKQLSQLIYQYGSLTASLLPSLGLAQSGKIMAIFAGTIAALSLVWPYIKPVPSTLPGNAKNWTQKSLQGGFVPQASAETLKKIREALKNNQHVLLVGPPRVGKTLTARAYAHAMAKGEYEEARGSVAFYLNMASIMGNTGYRGEVQILNDIGEVVSPCPDRIYLFIDEFHNACKRKGIAEGQLLSLLDEGGEYRHVVALTTDSEYKRYLVDKKTGQPTPLAKRFCIINIRGTDDNETIRILNDKLLTSLSKPLLTPDAIKTIHQESEEKGPQPHTSILLLKECIKATKTQQISQNEKALSQVDAKISRFYAEMAATRGESATGSLEDLLEERQSLERAVNTERNLKENLLNAKRQFDNIMTACYRSILKIAMTGNSILNLNSREENELKFYALTQLVTPLLTNYLETQAKALGITLTIDKACVQKCAQSLFAKQKALPPKNKRSTGISLAGRRCTSTAGKLRIRFPVK